MTCADCGRSSRTVAHSPEFDTALDDHCWADRIAANERDRDEYRRKAHAVLAAEMRKGSDAP